MWYRSIAVDDPYAMERFEEEFHFSMPEQFKEFLFENNAASASDVAVITDTATRLVSMLLDFNTHSPEWYSAWVVNKRMRSVLGPRRIAFANVGNHYLSHFLCMERHYQQRKLVVWNFITQEFEPVQMSWEEFLRKYGA